MQSDKIGLLTAQYLSRKCELEAKWQCSKRPRTRNQAFALLVKCILSSRTKWGKVVRVVDTMQASRVLYHGNVEQVLSHVQGTGGKAKWIVENRETFPFVWWIVDSVQRGKVVLRPDGIEPKEVFRQPDPYSFMSSSKERGLTQNALRALVQGLKGVGDKQASHFLYSIGIEGYAIIDTYILDKLVEFGIIKEKPKSLTSSQYHAIEQRLKEWCDGIGIPLHLLDMLWWRG